MKYFVLMFLFIQASITQAFDTVDCKGEFYSLDYLIYENEKLFGHVIEDYDPINVMVHLPNVMNQAFVFASSSHEVNEQFRVFHKNILSEDPSREMIWVPSVLEFPRKEVSPKEINLPSRCLNERGKFTLHTTILHTKQGDVDIFEYNENLMMNIKGISLQKDFVIKSSFLKLYISDLFLRARINHLVHSEDLIHGVGQAIIREELLRSGLLFQLSSNICERSSVARSAVEKNLALPCELISEIELNSIKNLVVDAAKIEKKTMGAGDLAGLCSLEKIVVKNTENNFLSVPLDELDCAKRLKSVELINNGHEMKALPASIVKRTSLEELKLIGNAQLNIKKDMFITYPKLKKLTISKNKSKLFRRENFGYLHLGALRGLNNLEEFELSHNLLRRVINRVFEDVPNLKKLNLSYNPIYRLKGSLNTKALSSLEGLNLSGTKIDRIPAEELVELKSLKILTLKNMQLHAFPFHIAQLPKLTTVEFCSLRFESKYESIKEKLFALNPRINITFCKNGL